MVIYPSISSSAERFGGELFLEIKHLDRQGLQRDYVVRYQPCHVQAMTTMTSYLQLPQGKIR